MDFSPTGLKFLERHSASEFLVPQGKDHLVSLYLREDRHVIISQTSKKQSRWTIWAK